MMIVVMVVKNSSIINGNNTNHYLEQPALLNTGYSSEHWQYTNLTPAALLEVGKLFLVPLFYRCFNNIFVIFVVVND